MKTKHFLLLSFISFAIVVASCKKDTSADNGNNQYAGTYDFVSMDASTVTSESYSDGGTNYYDIAYAGWHSKNNSGTVTIDSKNFTSSNLAYSIDTTINAYFYEDNVLQDSLEEPFAFDVPPSSGSSSYKLVTSDSIYFTGGSVLFNGATTSSAPSGAKLKWSGNILYLSASMSKDSTDNSSGFPVSIHEEATISVGLKKH